MAVESDDRQVAYAIGDMVPSFVPALWETATEDITALPPITTSELVQSSDEVIEPDWKQWIDGLAISMNTSPEVIQTIADALRYPDQKDPTHFLGRPVWADNFLTYAKAAMMPKEKPVEIYMVGKQAYYVADGSFIPDR